MLPKINTHAAHQFTITENNAISIEGFEGIDVNNCFCIIAQGHRYHEHGIANGSVLGISLERTSQECNHKNMAQTLGYGAASYMDEGDRSQLVLASVLPGQHDYTENGVPPMEPIVVSKTVYKQMETLPFIWYMPGHGVCQAPGCYPRFENCATCNHFVPDPQFKDAILQTIENLEGKVVSLKARNDTQKAIAFNERQIYAYNAMLQKIDRQEVKNEHLEI